jgi:hypothetical protein
VAIDLLTLLKSIGLPVTYSHWAPGKAPKPPYVAYLAIDANNFAADNVVYHVATNYQIELYSNQKDPASEALIEAALTEADIYYDKLEAYIDSEKLYQVAYLVQI